MVTDFTDCLQREYKALTEKSMEDFEVVLTKRGAEASVQIRPKVGNEVIGVVLSEGELRMHALVLFIAELENSAHSVIVLDDPITSFDYDYISNFCNRIRDFSLNYPERQVVILTHNWEFFVNIQTVLSKGLLGSHTSIQILENCAICMSYKDKPADLKLEIHSILSLPLEPTQKQKQEMAGSMRRLLESIVNKLVFNDQRHQYKQKSQAVSDFQKFTKLVPLDDEEAVELADLYSKLSVPEHDDPRNQFVGADKAMFRTRYDKILEIEAALLARKGS
jgi:ABC-type multidrug transport system ATPase subunit